MKSCKTQFVNALSPNVSIKTICKHTEPEKAAVHSELEKAARSSQYALSPRKQQRAVKLQGVVMWDVWWMIPHGVLNLIGVPAKVLGVKSDTEPSSSAIAWRRRLGVHELSMVSGSRVVMESINWTYSLKYE